MPRKAVFLDRDGVINQYLPEDYVKTPEELVILPGVCEAIAQLNKAQVPVFLISNQQGVGKGIMTQADLDSVQAKLDAELKEHGAHLDGVYYCTCLAGPNCKCRKPAPTMLSQACIEHDLDLRRSVFIGDTEGDAKAAKSAGVGMFILVMTGQTRPADIKAFTPEPHYLVSDLSLAVATALAEMGY
jgi:D-glycero-D-manno-heptose 1,7-bisphosphate phosphatase